MTSSTPPPDQPDDATGAPRADQHVSAAASAAGPDTAPADDHAPDSASDPPSPDGGMSTAAPADPSPPLATAAAATTRLPGPSGSRPAALWVAVAVALVFGLWGLWTLVAPSPDTPAATLRAQARQIEALQQQVATLSRSDQISRDANRDVQGTLAERDEEIAALRADVAFYERFVGATGQRRGLTVHELQVQPQGGTAWHFTATLTQNLNRGAVSSGRAALSLEGMQAGTLRRLDWAALRQQPGAPGVEYSFKYFQQIEGDVVLPPGFTPLRVRVRLSPQGAAPVEQSFAWADALRTAAGPG